ncbi:phytoene/squalene synthase family protein [Georgenia sp. AZ-5]|uniref:phytoene/squalene synthase family protein n=1 Tax=Georgenia sp. AZ-5 TaxID=3367526 RepID=UPI0037553A73
MSTTSTRRARRASEAPATGTAPRATTVPSPRTAGPPAPEPAGGPAPCAAVYDAVADAGAAAVIAGFSTSFGWACRLLRQPVRTRVRNVYALVRIADEVVDGPLAAADPAAAARMLDGLEVQVTDAARTGWSTNLAVHAFARTAARCGIGPELTGPFFASMRADLSVRTHDARSLERYVYGSAEVVGLMCLRVFLADEPGAERAYEALGPGARRLGAAFQKVNFLRDLAADRDELGRRYLTSGGFADATRDAVIDDIEADLAAAAAAVRHLPASSRRAVACAHGLFAELAGRLRRTPAETIRRTRVRVPGRVKARVVAAAVLGRPA